MQNKVLQADKLLALVMLVVSAVLLYGGWQLPASRFEPMGPSGMPLIVAITLAALSMVLLITAQLEHHSKPSSDQERSARLDPNRRATVLVCIGVSFVYLLVLAMELLPFMGATVVYIFVYGLIDGHRDRRSLVVLVATALGLGVGVSLLLSEILIVQLPGA